MNNRVILIKGNDSHCYEQAIFIMKQDRNPSSVNLVAEAERIINSYLNKGQKGRSEIATYGAVKQQGGYSSAVLASPTTKMQTGKKERFNIETILNISIFISSMVLLITLYNLFF